MSRAYSVMTPTHDCIFCCAFNVFFQQHKCYHRLDTNNGNNRSSEDLHRRTPSPTTNSKWFIQNDISRTEIATMLSDRPVGAFFVRPSKSCGVGSFVLSVRVPVFVNGNGIAHYLIVKTPKNRYKFQGTNDKDWSDIESLVIHHTIMREFLPCTLQMPSDFSSEAPSAFPHSYTSSTASFSLSSASSCPHLTRASSLVRASSKDHELLSDFLQSIRDRSSSVAEISSPKPSTRQIHSAVQRQTVCY